MLARLGSLLATLRVVSQIAFRNLFASRLKSVIVGGIVFFGAALVVVGGSFLDSLNDSMSRSVIGSVAGHIQIYSAKSKDDLALFGNAMGGDPDLAQLDDFSKVKAAVMKVPNVKEVVPMGVSGAMITSGNTIDLTLAKLREDLTKKLHGDASPELAARIDSEKAHVQQMVNVLQEDRKHLGDIADVSKLDPEISETLDEAGRPGFWAKFDEAPLDNLEFLENKVAPLAADADLLFIRYVGTDPQQFARTFDRMKIVDGTNIPPGQRGFLFTKFFYEEGLKLKSARRLDKIKEDLDVKHLTIAGADEVKQLVRQNVREVGEILLQLDPQQTRTLTGRLQKLLGSSEPDLGKLLASYFDVDDANFHDRYAFFYAKDGIAPLVNLYRIPVGSILTIKAFTRTGYQRSVNLRVYGTFEFSGLEKSPLAGALNVMDLVSFRELYGFMTADSAAEIAALKKEAGPAADVSEANAEQELFGAPPKNVDAMATPGLAMPSDAPSLGSKLRREDLVDRVYPAGEVQKGVVLNAAVILKDPKRLDQSILDIEKAGKDAGLPLKAVSWQKAAGLLGNLVYLLRGVLYVAVVIIFSVALVIINNAMVMATLQRVREIGTLRAIGAQRRFILAMLFVESIVVGLVFGLLGAGVGALIVKGVAAVGIPARSDVMFFFFSGPRLKPFLGAASVAGALVIVLLVSALSSFYPAWLAMRVTPRQAMSTEE